MCYCPCHGHAPRCPCCRSHPSSHTPCVTPITCAVVMHIVAHTLCCPCPSFPTPFIAHTLCCLRCVSHHSSPMSCVTPITCAMVVHLVACTVCRAPCRTHHALCLLPVLWSCTSSRVLCVAPLVARTMRCARCPCCGRAPHHVCCVSHPLSHVPCVVPLTCAVVVHLVTCTMCCAPHRAHRVSCPLPVLCGRAPCHAHRVSRPLSPVSCVVPIAHAVVVHLVCHRLPG